METGCLESGLYNMHLSSIQYIYFLNNSTSSHKEVKNEEQKKRVEKKNAALNVIRGLIINSSLISKDAKEERLTEVRETITLQRNKVELSFHTHVHTHTHTHTPHFNITKLSYLFTHMCTHTHTHPTLQRNKVELSFSVRSTH